MLKRMMNECTITLSISHQGPFLIKEGRYEKKDWTGNWEEKNYPDAIFISRNSDAELKSVVRNNNPGEYKNRLHFYIPGTSLRGVLRSQAERIVRTLTKDPETKPVCCDPFQDAGSKPDRSCSKRLEDRKSSSARYRDSCPICKLFGSTAVASRIRVADGDVIKKGKVAFRDGIGIDRFTGGVSHGANFRTQVLEGYTFRSTLTVRNFETWQLGLLAYVLRDLKEELIPIGFGKTKGYGVVQAKVTKATITYFGPNGLKGGCLMGIGDLCGEPERARYGLCEGQAVKVDELLNGSVSDGLSLRKTYAVRTPDAFGPGSFWANVAVTWNSVWDKKCFRSLPDIEEALKSKAAASADEKRGGADG